MTSHLPIPPGPDGFQRPPLEENGCSEGMPTPASAPDRDSTCLGKNMDGTPAAKGMEPEVTKEPGRTGLTVPGRSLTCFTLE